MDVNTERIIKALSRFTSTPLGAVDLRTGILGAEPFDADLLWETATSAGILNTLPPLTAKPRSTLKS